MPNPISLEGYEKLKAEWEHLWHQERPKLLEEIAAAAAQGDRSENAEYIYGRKKLREIDRRLRELDGKITRATVVSGPRRDDRIYLGARVTLEKKGGGAMVVSLVGDDEIDPAAGRISRNSPLGAALLGREPFGTFGIETPRGPQEYKILSVEY
jgi:transcription elongation factor GreB